MIKYIVGSFVPQSAITRFTLNSKSGKARTDEKQVIEDKILHFFDVSQ